MIKIINEDEFKQRFPETIKTSDTIKHEVAEVINKNITDITNVSELLFIYTNLAATALANTLALNDFVCKTLRKDPSPDGIIKVVNDYALKFYDKEGGLKWN
mgnify:CR=1 FL=1